LNLNFRESAFLRYATAILSVQLAIIARTQLDEILGNHAVHATFYLAVLISAAVGGWKPGLLALVLGELSAMYLFVEPRYTFALGDVTQRIGTAIFLIVGSAAICLTEAQRIAQRQAEAAIRQLKQEMVERRAAELERYQLLEELERERSRLNAILQQMPVGVLIAEAPSGKVLFGNEELGRILRRPFSAGLESNEHQEGWRGFHPDGQPYQPEDWPLARAVSTGELVEDEEIQIELADGTTIQAEVNAAPLEDSQCRIEAGIMTLHDITARKAAETRLAESEERYRSLFENNPDPVFTVDLQGRFTTLNPAALRLSGYCLAELQGTPFTDICAREKVEEALRYFAFALSGEPKNLETVLITREGRRVDLFINGGPVMVKRQAVGVFAIASDITEQKRTQARLAAFSQLGQSLSSVRTPVEASRIIGDVAEALFGWDAFSLSLCSEGSNEIQRVLQVDTINSEKSELLPLRRQLGIPPRVQQILRNGAELVLREGATTLLSDCVPFGDAARPSASLMFVPLRDKGKSIGVLSIQSYRSQAYDEKDLVILQSLADYCGGALERIRAEECLRNSEEEYRTMFDLVGSGNALAHPVTGRYLRVNPKLCEITGYSAEELLEKTFLEITHPEDRPINIICFEQLVRGEASVSQFEKRYLRKDGEIRWVHVVATLLRDVEGRPVRALCSLTDITERKREQAQLVAFSRLGQSLSSVATPGEASRIIGGIAEDLFGWDAFSLSLCSLGSDQIRSICHVDTIAGQKRETTPTVSKAGIPPITRRILEHGAELILKEDPATWLPDCVPFGDPARPCASLMFVPIRDKARAIGVLSIQSHERQAYDPKDLAMLQSVADCCGGALERIRVEDALRESENRFTSFMQHVPGTVWMKDLQGRYLYANASNQLMLAKTQGEILGRTDEELFPPEAVQQFRESDQLVRTSGKGLQVIERIPGFGGDRYCLVSKFPIRDKDGTLTIVAGVAIDITDRKRAEDALRESETRFASFMDNLPGIAWMKDLQGRYLYVNPASQKLYEKSPDEIYGLTDDELFPPGTAEQFQQNDNLVLANGMALQAIETCPSTEGERHFIVNKFPIRGKDGLTTIIAGMAIDITERRLAEEALARSNKRLSSITKVTNTVMGTAPLAEQVRELAETVRAAYGVSSCIIRVLEGSDLVLLASSGRREQQLHPRLPLAASFGRKIVAARVPLSIRDARTDPFPDTTAEVVPDPYAFVSYAGAPLLAQDRVIGVMGIYTETEVRDFTAADLEQLQIIANHAAVAIVNDGLYSEINCQKRQLERQIGERQQAEEEVQRLNASLERRVQERTAQLVAANQELEAFCYSVSHDLRAPLRSIAGFAQALEEDSKNHLDEDGQDCLRRVIQSSREMDQLIDDLLHLSSLTRSDMSRQPVDLSALAQSVMEGLRQAEPERVVEFRVADPLPPTHGDGRLLRIALENLLNNAWKFTGKRAAARIEFGIEQGPEGPVYFVRDNGAGFDMEYAGKLFGAFQRLHNSTEFPGHGIGLATVQRIINRHGGHTWAVSEVNRGATFYFTLSA
jgi:PAS domain S-box-containing protein